MGMRDGIEVRHLCSSGEKNMHNFNGAANCYCEPEIHFAYNGTKLKGRLIVHQKLEKKIKRTRAGDNMT